MTEEYVLRAGLDSRGFVKGAQEVQHSMVGVQTAANTLRNALAVLGVAISAQKIISVNTEFERLGAQLETVTGSVQNASVAFRELERFAANTPFQLNDVVEAFTQLKARGLDPSIDSITAWGDLASSMGRNVGDAIRAVGAATVGEMEALKSFGIQATQAGDKVSFTFKGTTELVDRNSRAIEAYLKRLAENNFAGSMERQSRTLGGAFSNLEDSVAGALRSFGQGGFNDALRETVKQLTAITDASRGTAATMGSWVGDVMANVRELSGFLGNAAEYMVRINQSGSQRRSQVQSIIPSPVEAATAAARLYSEYVGKPFADALRSLDKFLQNENTRMADGQASRGGTYASAGELAAEQARENARARGFAAGPGPFAREAQTSASAQLTQLSNNLQRQAAFASVVGPMGELLKQLGDAQTGLDTPQLLAFARTGALPQTSETFTTGSRDELRRARDAQMAIYEEERRREERGRDIGIQGSNERAAGYAGGNVRAIEEATAAEKARQAVLKDGRNFEIEYRRQLEELDARNKETAAQRLAQTEQQTAGTQRLLDAVKGGARDTAELEARNEALAAAAENSQVNVEKLTEAILNNRRASAQLDYERATRQIERANAAAGRYTIVLNEVTRQYEVQNRELEIANRLTDDLIAKYGEAGARRMVEAQVDSAEAQRRIGQEAERARVRVEANDWTAGAERGLIRYQDTALNMASTVENTVVNAFQGMEDAMVKFVQTGKLDFASLADSIVADLIRIQVRAQLTAAIGGAGSGGLGGLFGSIFGGGGGGGAPNAFTAPVGDSFGFAGFEARGDAFMGGNVIPFAKGGVVQRPTTFPLSDKRTGLMGEAGPEAIIPLARDGNGRLGVRAQGGGDGTMVQIIDQRSSSAPPVETQRSAGPDGRQQIRVLIRDETSGLMRGGGFDKVMRNTFGVNRTPAQR